jgi:dTDP-4-dehydrorhamnose 3,5-epimerase
MSADMIHDVVIRELKIIKDGRGQVMHMMRADAPNFDRFGEIYFSLATSGAVKAWKRHREMTLNLAVPLGTIRLVLADLREGSPSCGTILQLDIGEDNYCLVTIPPGIWSGFKCVSNTTAIVANCATLPHDPEEIDRMPSDSSKIAYQWG